MTDSLRRVRGDAAVGIRAGRYGEGGGHHDLAGGERAQASAMNRITGIAHAHNSCSDGGKRRVAARATGNQPDAAATRDRDAVGLEDGESGGHGAVGERCRVDDALI